MSTATALGADLPSAPVPAETRGVPTAGSDTSRVSAAAGTHPPVAAGERTAPVATQTPVPSGERSDRPREGS